MDEAMKRVAANICQSAALCDDTQSDKLIFHYQQNEVRFWNEKLLLHKAGFDTFSEGASITVMSPTD